jgi:LacI family transcriptional regulator
MPVDVSDLCCVNSQCPDVGRRGGNNVRFDRWTGVGKDIRFVRCRTCKAEFSERKGTPLFGAKLPVKEIESITRHLIEGDSLRKTGRLTEHKQDTVARWGRRLGTHAKNFHQEKAQNLDVREAQFDEMWSFVKKKRKISSPRSRARAVLEITGATSS